MKFLSKLGLALIVLIVAPLTMCAFEKRTVYADPKVAPALEAAQADGQAAVAALSKYYAAHAFFPRSASELGSDVPGLSRFHYEVWSMDRVYQSLPCAARAKDFEGITIGTQDYAQRLSAFRAECVRGYANFVLKSRPIQTAWQVNRGLVVYAQFSSRDARWSVEWCGSRQHNPALRDCSQNAFDESVPEAR